MSPPRAKTTPTNPSRDLKAQVDSPMDKNQIARLCLQSYSDRINVMEQQVSALKVQLEQKNEEV